MSRIYLASSWRNPSQPALVSLLREAGHEVYDFRNPEPDNRGFAWSQIDPAWRSWSAEQFRRALSSRVALAGWVLDQTAMNHADTCVLALPCGRSAHLEAGFMAGQGKEVIVFIEHLEEPELMYLTLGDTICVTTEELLAALEARHDR